MWKFALIILASACTASNAWEMPQAKVHAVAVDPAMQDAWEQAVIEAVSDWDVRLEATGCPTAFVIEDGDDSHELQLIPQAQWTATGFNGFEDSTHIWVHSMEDGTPPIGGTTRHELGHALGLVHTNPADGPSVMTAIAGPYIEARDVSDAADLLGCH